MPRTSALSALALLVVVGLAVGTAGAVITANGADPAPTMRSVPNTTNYLSVDTPTRQSYARSDVDVMAAVQADAERLHGQHADFTFDSRFRASEGDESARLAAVRAAVTRTEGRLDQLDARQAALLQSYSQGNISRDVFLRRLVRLSVEVRQARQRLDHVRSTVDASLTSSLPVPLDTEISNLQSELVVLPSPVTERIEAGLRGQRDPLVVYVGGDDGGIVLSAVDGNDFVRQATLRSEYAPDQPDQFDQPDQRSITLAFRRGGELYPWAYDNAIGGPQIGPNGAKSYLITVNHPQGSVRTYIHGGTRNVYHEIQEQRPNALPTDGTASATSDSLELSVRTTTATGPMQVTVSGTGVNRPVDGTVRIDGQVVGQTGGDGQLWTVQPSGSTRVNATVGNESVAVTL